VIPIKPLFGHNKKKSDLGTLALKKNKEQKTLEMSFVSFFFFF